MKNNDQNTKRLVLDVETVRHLETADLDNVAGGAAKGGGNGDQAAGFTDSISISIGKQCVCNCK